MKLVCVCFCNKNVILLLAKRVSGRLSALVTCRKRRNSRDSEWASTTWQDRIATNANNLIEVFFVSEKSALLKFSKEHFLHFKNAISLAFRQWFRIFCVNSFESYDDWKFWPERPVSIAFFVNPMLPLSRIRPVNCLSSFCTRVAVCRYIVERITREIAPRGKDLSLQENNIKARKTFLKLLSYLELWRVCASARFIFCASHKKLTSALLLSKLSDKICPKLVRIVQW